MFIAIHERVRRLRRPPPALESLLCRLPLFQELDREALARIAEAATELEAPRGAMVLRRGDPCDGLYVVVFGQVKLALQTAQGGERVIELVGAGASFGETAIFLDEPNVLTVEALADTRLVHLAKSSVLEEFEREPRFARGLAAALSLRLHRLIEDLEGYTLRSGTERVIDYLLRELPQQASGRAAVVLPVKKGILASRLNLTREHFSRILHDLAAHGLIEVNGREVRIGDVDALRARGAKEGRGAHREEARSRCPGAARLSEFRC